MNIGYALYELHIFALVSLVVIYMYRPAVRGYLILLFLPFLLLHLMGMGCPFTRLERYFHGEDITIIDPFLNMFGIYPSYDNRKTFQAWFSTMLILWMMLLFIR